MHTKNNEIKYVVQHVVSCLGEQHLSFIPSEFYQITWSCRTASHTSVLTMKCPDVTNSVSIQSCWGVTNVTLSLRGISSQTIDLRYFSLGMGRICISQANGCSSAVIYDFNQVNMYVRFQGSSSHLFHFSKYRT